MKKVSLEKVSKSFGHEKVLTDLDLEIESGSFTILLGPSGCGKSTILRIIAGLEKMDSGKVIIDGRDYSNIEPGDRNIAMVFQNYALYPTMTVSENIEFGLRNLKVPKEEIKKRMRDVIEQVHLGDYLKKKPQFLSGGQRQRVALARAMVKQPNIFLMDEPLSNLDATLRVQLRTELIELHRRVGTTFIYVTHDQTEAMSMGTNVVLLEKGAIRQAGDPASIYKKPENIFCARFIGTPPMNLIKKKDPNNVFTEDSEFIGFRPEKARICLTDKEIEKNCVHYKGELVTHEMLGSETIFKVRVGEEYLNIRTYNDIDIPYGECFVFVPYTDLFFFDREGNVIKNGGLS